MHAGVRPWLVVVPLATIGMTAGHALAYRLTGMRQGDVHAYLSHLPQIALVLVVLACVGARLVEQRARLALWPFPAVALLGFVLQEHLERLAHTGAVPFLLDQPVFLVGLGAQGLVAVACWLVARALVRVIGRPSLRRAFGSRLQLPGRRCLASPRADRVAGLRRTRSPPLVA